MMYNAIVREGVQILVERCERQQGGRDVVNHFMLSSHRELGLLHLERCIMNYCEGVYLL